MSLERFREKITYALLFGFLGESFRGCLEIVELFLKTLFRDLCSTGNKK